MKDISLKEIMKILKRCREKKNGEGDERNVQSKRKTTRN